MENNSSTEPPDNSVTPTNPVAPNNPETQPPTAGLSAEDVQQIATAVATLVGRSGASSGANINPLVSGPPQVPVQPTAGTQLFVVLYILAPPYTQPVTQQGRGLLAAFIP